MASVKVQLTLDVELLARIDQMASALYTNRSAYIAVTLAQVLNTQEKAMGILERATNNALQRIDDTPKDK